MDTKLATRQIRIQQWAAIFKDRTSSGLKVDDYCQQHDISRDAYYYWLRKVKEAALTQSGFVEINPLQLIPDTKDKPQLVVDINGIKLDIHEGTSMDLLSQVIQVLKNA